MSNTGFKLILALFCGTCLNVTASYANEIKAGDVYVTATRIERELQDVPMSVTVMTSEDIKKSSARSVGELLEDVSGVQIQSSGSQGLKRVKIRGEDPYRTVILVDGQKISEQKSMDGAAILIAPFSIERIEVIKGPASVLYGSDAIGGVINIITKKGGEKTLQGDAYAGFNGASFGWSEGLSVYGAENGWKYRLSGSYSDQKNIRTPAGTYDNTGFRNKNFNGFLSYDFSEDFTAGFAADYFKGSYNSTSMEYADAPNQDFFVHIPKWERQKYSAFAELKNINDYLVRIRADVYHQRTQKNMNNSIITAAHVSNFVDNVVYTQGASLQTDWQLGANNYLIAGYEIYRDKLNADGSGDVFIPAMGVYAQRSSNYYDGTQLNQSLFASMETVLPHSFTLNYGVRWTHVRSELDDGGITTSSLTRPFPVPTYGTTFDAVQKGSETDSHPVFTAGLTWAGIENLTLRANWAQGFRVPLLQERYVQSNMGGGIIYPNADLDPETSNNFEVGARWFDGVTTADISFFYSKADDYIAQIPTSITDTFRYENIAKATTFGSELSFGHDFATPHGTFTPYTTITFMRRKYDDGSGFTTYDTATPEFFGRYGVRYAKALLETVDFYADLYWRSQSETVYRSKTGSSDYSLGGFTTTNFAMGLDFGQEKQYNFTVELLNIFDKRYQYSTSLYEPGTNINLKLSMSF